MSRKASVEQVLLEARSESVAANLLLSALCRYLARAGLSSVVEAAFDNAQQTALLTKLEGDNTGLLCEILAGQRRVALGEPPAPRPDPVEKGGPRQA